PVAESRIRRFGRMFRSAWHGRSNSRDGRVDRDEGRQRNAAGTRAGIAGKDLRMGCLPRSYLQMPDASFKLNDWFIDVGADVVADQSVDEIHQLFLRSG